jgi:hypothetical protein
MRRAKLHLIEYNHVAGRANDPDLTVPMCLNCHARYSAMQRLNDVDLEWYPERTALDWVRDSAAQIAYLLRQLADVLELWAEALGTASAGLDDKYPFWRHLPSVNVKPGSTG